MDNMTATATALFESTTGFTVSNIVSWAGDIILMILGMGLALVEAILPWILALVVIGVIVRLIYKALQFLRIIR